MKFTIPALILAIVPAGAATLTGLWEFNNSSNPGQATVGSNLTFAGSAPGTWSASLADDSSTPLTGVVTTAVGPANIIYADHGIAANGGGALVNEWSVLVDIYSPAGSRGAWRSIFQTHTGNINDGDYFVSRTDTVGVGDITYSPGVIDETKWTRLLITIDLAPSGASDIRAYVNGSLFHTHTLTGGLDGRFALGSTLLFFSDESGENAPMHVGAIAMWDGALTAGEAAGLGTAGAAVIPESSTSVAGASALLFAAMRRRRQARKP
ncbi:MAG: hypothetical protein J0M04_13740 [Verrucomicrobia bacterium]|nr:hypothetical protein [Verrucomicrobiota bacterium]